MQLLLDDAVLSATYRAVAVRYSMICDALYLGLVL